MLLAVAVLSLGWATELALAAQVARPSSATAHGAAVLRARALRRYVRLPLSFEPNLGQSDSDVKYLAHGQGYSLFLTANRAVLSLLERGANAAPSSRFQTLSLDLRGASAAPHVSASDRMPGVSNYLLGNDPRHWHTNVPHYARIHYRDIYPGVDLVYYGRQQQLEYDFVVTPGADASRIRLEVRGAKALNINRKGDLVLSLPGGAIELRQPQAYQQSGNRRQLVSARYRVEGDQLTFQLANYDHARSLVIDPQLVYFSYLGGSSNETSPSVAVDSGLNAYVAGTTSSNDFPPVNALQGSLKGTTNVFVTKFNPAASAVRFSTYLGGSGTDSAAGIAVDAGFNVYVAGTTNSSDFPVTPGSAVQSSPKSTGMNHAFLTELNSSGGGPVYSTYLSGSGVDAGRGVAVGPLAGTVFVTGTTQSSDFLNVAKAAGRGTNQFFVTKLNTGKQGAASLVYAFYLGGSNPSTGVTDGGGIAVDPSGNAYVTGGTNYSDMPVVNAFPGGATLRGTENAFVAKFNPNGTFPPLFLAYLGGSGTDIGNGIAADSAGNAYVTGSTTSASFPIVASPGTTPYQAAIGGGTDAFVAKVASAGSSVIWSTFIGGTGADSGQAIAVDANQNTFVTGSTAGGLNLLNATQTTFGGGASDAFVAKFDISGNAQNGFVTYLGGTVDDHGTGIAVDTNGNPYVAGDTTSGGLATTGTFQTALKGGSDAFVAHYGGVSDVGFGSSTLPAVSVSPNPLGIGNPATFSFNIANSGPDIATAVVFTDTLPSNGTFQSATSSQGTCSAAAGTVVCNLGQMPKSATASVTVQIAGTTAAPLADTATLISSSIDPNPGNNSASASVSVNDFSVSANPTTANVPDGQAATYTVTVSPTPQGAGFPNGVSLKCSAGVPTAALCAFSTNPVIPNGTPVTSSLTISTTAPPPGTTAGLFGQDLRRMYAVILPLGGMVFLGFALGGDTRRRKRLAGFFLLVLVLGITGLQMACSSSNTPAPPPPFTPKGSYTITVSATSGSVTHTFPVSMTVQ